MKCDFCNALGVSSIESGAGVYEVTLLDRGNSPGEGLLGYADIESAFICVDCLSGWGIDRGSLPITISDDDDPNRRIRFDYVKEEKEK